MPKYLYKRLVAIVSPPSSVSSIDLLKGGALMTFANVLYMVGVGPVKNVTVQKLLLIHYPIESSYQLLRLKTF